MHGAPQGRPTPTFGRRFARQLLRLIGIYWRSRDAKWGGLLLALAVGLELATVYGNLLLADRERLVFDALQHRNAADFVKSIVLLLVAALGFVLVSTYRIYVRQTVEIRWRRTVTAHYVDRWIRPQSYTQLALRRAGVDNPDQRIQEDTRDFVASALGLSLSLLSAVTTLATFGGLLWTLSRDWTIPVWGFPLHIPGLLLWVVLGYALFSTLVTHFVGRRLVPINFDRLRFEADFRYGLVHFRDHVDGVTFSNGESNVRHGALARFRFVLDNWWQLIRAQLQLSLVTSGISQANGLVPILMAAPAFFAGLITLGVVVQIRFAYNQVSSALTWFVSAYQEIARWRANIERLSAFAEEMDANESNMAGSQIAVVPVDEPRLRLRDLRLCDPEGIFFIDGANATIERGERVAVVGPSGSGKTALLHAIAGIWPFGSGRIELPADARTFFAPQQPYLPIGSLRAVACFPASEGTFPDDAIREVLREIGLGRLETRLDDAEAWEQYLSPLDQQRIGLGRVLLHQPDWVFLDKATSALDEDLEKQVYELIAEKLPNATVVSVADRPSLMTFHTRRWTLEPGAGGCSDFQAA